MCKIFSCLGQLLYTLERLASCCVMTAVVTCLIATILTILSVGVGLGYHYCFVDTKMATEGVNMTELAAQTDPADKPKLYRRIKDNITTTTDMDFSVVYNFKYWSTPRSNESYRFGKPNRDFVTYSSYNWWWRRHAGNLELSTIPLRSDVETTTNPDHEMNRLEKEPTIVVPLRNVDLLSLITKLRERKKNITLKLLGNE